MALKHNVSELFWRWCISMKMLEETSNTQRRVRHDMLLTFPSGKVDVILWRKSWQIQSMVRPVCNVDTLKSYRDANVIIIIFNSMNNNYNCNSMHYFSIVFISLFDRICAGHYEGSRGPVSTGGCWPRCSGWWPASSHVWGCSETR